MSIIMSDRIMMIAKEVKNLTISNTCQSATIRDVNRCPDRTLLLIEFCLRIIVLGIGDTFESKRAAAIPMELLPESGAQT